MNIHHFTIFITCQVLYLLWLVSCINLIGLWGAHIFGKTLFWECLWGYFSERETFKSGLSKTDCAPNVGGPHLISEGLTRTKGWLLSKEEFLLSDCLRTWDISFFPTLGLNRNIAFPGPRLCCPLGRNGTIGSHGSQAFRKGPQQLPPTFSPACCSSYRSQGLPSSIIMWPSSLQ